MNDIELNSYITRDRWGDGNGNGEGGGHGRGWGWGFGDGDGHGRGWGDGRSITGRDPLDQGVIA